MRGSLSHSLSLPLSLFLSPFLSLSLSDLEGDSWFWPGEEGERGESDRHSSPCPSPWSSPPRSLWGGEVEEGGRRRRS